MVESHSFIMKLPNLRGHDVSDADVCKMWPSDIAVVPRNNQQSSNITEQHGLTLNLHVRLCLWDSIRLCAAGAAYNK